MITHKTPGFVLVTLSILTITIGCESGNMRVAEWDAGDVERDSGAVDPDSLEPDAGGVVDAGSPVDPCSGVTCSGHGRCDSSSGEARCICDPGYEADGTSCVELGPCDGVTCSGHGHCVEHGGRAVCDCDPGFRAVDLHCVAEDDPCAGQDCSGHGQCMAWGDLAVCACDVGFSPRDRSGLECVPTERVVTAGAIDYDADGDGEVDQWFEPTPDEMRMYELINWTRATHDPEGSPECHQPLLYDRLWSAHARNHSRKMFDAGHLFHEDYPMGQNCAMGCGPDCEMDMYMNWQGEDHCNALSHHCNIMRCSFSRVGVGYWAGTWNTQNFL